MIKNKSPFVIYLNPVLSFRKLLFVNLVLFPNTPIIFLFMFKFILNSSYSETRIQKNVTSQFLSQHQEFSSYVLPHCIVCLLRDTFDLHSCQLVSQGRIFSFSVPLIYISVLTPVPHPLNWC